MSSSFPVVRKQLLAFFLATLLIIAATFTALLWSNSNQIRDIQSQNNILQSQNAALYDQNNALQNQLAQQQNQADAVKQNETDSQHQTSMLQAQNEDLNAQLSSLKQKISTLQSQLMNLTTANLVANLDIGDASGYQYKDMYIEGSVGNNGLGTAYNAGLLVIAYSSEGVLRINMTVPLVIAAFGVDNATSAVAATLPWQEVSLQLGNVGTGVTVPVSIGIFHYDAVSNWTVTPVWTNQP
jgi:hypothetical protein